MIHVLQVAAAVLAAAVAAFPCVAFPAAAAVVAVAAAVAAAGTPLQEGTVVLVPSGLTYFAPQLARVASYAPSSSGAHGPP
eukprot:COSAG05_NODE_1290_length_5264_cov_2884.921394_1_plen_81_part_00